MTADAPLTKRQQQMMAYVDDELGVAERAAFEREMEQDAGLALETVSFKNLLDASKSMALAEPTDHEMRRFWARFYNRAEWRLGWVLLLSGVVVLAVEGLYLLLTSALPLTVKGSAIAIVAGGSVLLWNTVRLTLRTSHFDRYRGVMR
ncbi:MAG: hypothetical protein AAF628_08745 [Planctomycetota bacterium]